MARSRTKISALMYHDVVAPGEEDTSGFAGAVPARYKLDWESFRAHLDSIGERTGEAPALLGEALAGGRSADGWALTFDDGGASALAIGEELDRRGWRGHFFVVSDLIGTPSFLGAEDVVTLAGMGHVIGSHSHTHPRRMASLPGEQIAAEWRDSVSVLSGILGHDVDIASVPGGSFSRKVAQAAAASGIRILCTSEPVRAVGDVDGCALVGRAAIRRSDRASTAAALAAGSASPWLMGRGAWTARKVLKAVGGAGYDRARGAVLSRSR